MNQPTLLLAALTAVFPFAPIAPAPLQGPRDYGTAGAPPLLHAAKEPKAATIKVTIQKMRFTPSTVSLRPGDTVTWVNRDQHDHTIDAADESFASGPLNPGESFSHKFTRPGKITYTCALHPRMRGALTVK